MKAWDQVDRGPGLRVAQRTSADDQSCHAEGSSLLTPITRSLTDGRPPRPAPCLSRPGFLSIRLRPWLRRLVTRGTAIIPATVVAAVMGREGVANLLVMSQVGYRNQG